MKKVVFDIDDTLWPLNTRVCELTGVDYHKLVTFSIYENPYLSKEEGALVLEHYAKPSVFENICWFEGVERINSLKADVYINSNNANEECARIKRKQVDEFFQLPEDHICFNVTGNEKNKLKKKVIDEDTFIFVDDSSHNVAESPAKYNIMIKTPWNSSPQGKAQLNGKEVVYFDTFHEAMDYIEELLTED